jgi:hypothetical protein
MPGIAESVWAAGMSILLVLVVAMLAKALAFAYIYDSGTLTSLQVLVDGRLWSFDAWFWLFAGAFVAAALLLNLASKFSLRSLEDRKDAEMTRRLKRLGAVGRGDSP